MRYTAPNFRNSHDYRRDQISLISWHKGVRTKWVFGLMTLKNL